MTDITITLTSTDCWHLNRILEQEVNSLHELSAKCNDRALAAFRNMNYTAEKSQSEWADNYHKWAEDVDDLRKRLNSMRPESQKKCDLNQDY